MTARTVIKKISKIFRTENIYLPIFVIGGLDFRINSVTAYNSKIKVYCVDDSCHTLYFGFDEFIQFLTEQAKQNS
jgi:hypothetical protein